MDWTVAVGIAEVIGTIAVVISLGYVALQIRQNTNATRVASAQNLVTVSTNAHFLMASDNDLAKILQKGLYDPDALEDYEQLKMNSLFLGGYVQYDFAYRQYIKGQLEPDTWERMEFEMLLFIQMPGGAKWWEQDKSRLSPQFVTFIEDKLSKFQMPGTIPTVGTRKNESAT